MEERKSNDASGFSRQSISRRSSYNSSSNEVDNTIWECVIPYVEDAHDRSAVSLVCKRWHEIDRITRKHVTIAFCYSTTPQQLRKRFPQLESLKLKGKSRHAMFNLLPEDWGGYVTPWVKEIVKSFTRMKVLHFRRMIVKDSDLELLAVSSGKVLEVLRLDKCSGFSTDGLLHIARSCRNLRHLLMEDSSIIEKDGEWLHQLASNNTVLESLNFYLTELAKVRSADLKLIAQRCPSLTSVKISDIDMLELVGFLRTAPSLKEFGGGSFNDTFPGVQVGEGQYDDVVLPSRLLGLGLGFLGNEELLIVYPVAPRLTKLDLVYAMLDTEGHCMLLRQCPNLEILEAREVIGDRGLEVLAECCKRLKRLRVEQGDDVPENIDGVVSHRGLIALAHECLELEYLAVYASNITNEALRCMGGYSKQLRDFRLVLLNRQTVTDLPLDDGVRSLLTGCHKLRRFSLYLHPPGGLTDVGLGYIGQNSPNVISMLLGNLGESDDGLLEFSKGCPSLQKLDMVGDKFSERALAIAALQLKAVRYFSVQGYPSSANYQELLSMVRPYWNIEVIPPRPAGHGRGGRQVMYPVHVMAYHSLAGQRTDFPATVRLLDMQP